MARYRVNFFKKLTSSYGKVVNVCQRSIVIPSARNPAQAIKAAQAELVRLEHVAEWTLRADAVEAEIADGVPVDSVKGARCIDG